MVMVRYRITTPPVCTECHWLLALSFTTWPRDTPCPNCGVTPVKAWYPVVELTCDVRDPGMIRYLPGVQPGPAVQAQIIRDQALPGPDS